MQTPIKFVFKVKCRNGAIVSNLRINGMDLNHAKSRLEQMYPKSTLLACHALDAQGNPTTIDDDAQPAEQPHDWLKQHNN